MSAFTRPSALNWVTSLGHPHLTCASISRRMSADVRKRVLPQHMQKSRSVFWLRKCVARPFITPRGKPSVPHPTELDALSPAVPLRLKVKLPPLPTRLKTMMKTRSTLRIWIHPSQLESPDQRQNHRAQPNQGSMTMTLTVSPTWISTLRSLMPPDQRWTLDLLLSKRCAPLSPKWHHLILTSPLKHSAHSPPKFNTKSSETFASNHARHHSNAYRTC